MQNCGSYRLLREVFMVIKFHEMIVMSKWKIEEGSPESFCVSPSREDAFLVIYRLVFPFDVTRPYLNMAMASQNLSFNQYPSHKKKPRFILFCSCIEPLERLVEPSFATIPTESMTRLNISESKYAIAYYSGTNFRILPPRPYKDTPYESQNQLTEIDFPPERNAWTV